jgi:hypothetical protein
MHIMCKKGRGRKRVSIRRVKLTQKSSRPQNRGSMLRVDNSVNFYAIIIVLCISIDKSNIRTRSLRNTHSQETQHLSWETL